MIDGTETRHEHTRSIALRLAPIHDPLPHFYPYTTMSGFNPNAPSFVPNANAAAFVPSFARPSQPKPEPTIVPVIRQEQTEAPRPPPTLSLSSMTSKPAPPPAARDEESAVASKPNPVQPAPVLSSAPSPQPAKIAKNVSKPAPSQSNEASSKTFTTAKAKTTADAVKDTVHAVADQETLKDLFGDCEFFLGHKRSSYPNRIIVKQHLNIVFIGHVDAGKSTMGGNILFLTGMVDKRTMEKYEKEAKDAGRESWYLSWALDSTPQERDKGKTVEVGRGYFETDSKRYTILDAPGHKTYVPHMIQGAAQADVAVLVISARKGEFETGFEKGGQTREHVMLVKTAGVAKLVVAINKMDDATVGWDKARYDEVVSKITPFIKGAGYNPKTDVTFIPVSAQAGLNLKDRVPDGVAPWWR